VGNSCPIGSDNPSREAVPPEIEGNYIANHTKLRAQHGVPPMELVNLEAIAAGIVYEFASIGPSLKPPLIGNIRSTA